MVHRYFGTKYAMLTAETTAVPAKPATLLLPEQAAILLRNLYRVNAGSCAP